MAKAGGTTESLDRVVLVYLDKILLQRYAGQFKIHCKDTTAFCQKIELARLRDGNSVRADLFCGKIGWIVLVKLPDGVQLLVNRD